MPRFKLVNTENGDSYQNPEEAREFYNIIPPEDNGCNSDFKNNVTVRDYWYTITAKSPSANRSIVMCGLQYIPLNFSSSARQICFSSNVALIVLQPPSISSAVEFDDRSCSEKLEGPFDSDSFSTSKIVHLTADENDTVLVKCRISCQDFEGEYIPYVRLDITEDGRNYDNPSDGRELYELTQLTNDSCNSERNVTEFEYIYQITAKSESVDRSIVRCELRYVPGRNLSEQTCYSSNFAWIKLAREKATTMSNDMHPGEAITITHEVIGHRIPDKASIPSVTILTVLVVILGVLLFISVLILINHRFQWFSVRRKEVKIKDTQTSSMTTERTDKKPTPLQNSTNNITMEMEDTLPGYIPDKETDKQPLL